MSSASVVATTIQHRKSRAAGERAPMLPGATNRSPEEVEQRRQPSGSAAVVAAQRQRQRPEQLQSSFELEAEEAPDRSMKSLNRVLTGGAADEESEQRRQLWVGKIASGTTKEALEQAFAEFGTIESCDPREPKEGKSTTWALVKFSTADAAEKALAAEGTLTGAAAEWAISVAQHDKLKSEAAKEIGLSSQVSAKDKRSAQHHQDRLIQTETVAEMARTAEEAVGEFAGWFDEETANTPKHFDGVAKFAEGGFHYLKDTVGQGSHARLMTMLGGATSSEGQSAGLVRLDTVSGDEDLDADSEKLLKVLRPMMLACMSYAARVADNEESDIVKEGRRRLLFVGDENHELLEELQDSWELHGGQRDGGIHVVSTVEEALKDVESRHSAVKSGDDVSDYVRYVVVATDATTIEPTDAERLAQVLGGAVPVCWYVAPAAVPESKMRRLLLCGWEPVDSGLGRAHARELLQPARRSCCEGCLRLVRRTMHRFVDRHTKHVFEALQKYVAVLLEIQPWRDNYKPKHGEEGPSFRHILLPPEAAFSETPRRTEVRWQRELLRVLQLVCEGNCEDGQNLLLSSGMLSATCAFLQRRDMAGTMRHYIVRGQGNGDTANEPVDDFTGSLRGSVERLDPSTKIFLVRQAVLTVIEGIQGPNEECRKKVLDNFLHDHICDVLIIMSHHRHKMMRRYHEAHQLTMAQSGKWNKSSSKSLGRSSSGVATSGASLDRELSSPDKRLRKTDLVFSGKMGRMLQKETSLTHIDMLNLDGDDDIHHGHSELDKSAKGPVRAKPVTSSGTEPSIQELAHEPKHFEVELLEHVCIEFLRSCIGWVEATDDMFLDAEGNPLGIGKLLGDHLFHSLLTHWRFHTVLSEIENGEDTKRQKSAKKSIHSGRSAQQRKMILVSYWMFLDELLSIGGEASRDEREPSHWDQNGLEDLKIKRVEIQREDASGRKRIVPFYFRELNADEEHLTRIGKAEQRLEDVKRDTWHDEIMGTDDMTGVWDHAVSSSERRRNKNLDVSVRQWLLNLLLSRRLRDPHLRPSGFFSKLWFFFTTEIGTYLAIYIHFLSKLRLFLVIVVNALLVIFTQDRDKIYQSEQGLPPFGSAKHRLFAEDNQNWQKVCQYLGLPILILSILEAMIVLTQQLMTAVAVKSLKDAERQKVQNGEYSQHEHAWMFTEEPGGRSKLNCYGTRKIITEMKIWSWTPTLGWGGNIVCMWEVVLTPYVFYFVFFVITALMGLTTSPLFYCFHILDVCGFSPALRGVAKSASTYFVPVLTLTLASFSVMYIFAVFYFYFFPNSFVDPDSGYSPTTSLYETVIFTLNYGFRAGGGIADVIQPATAVKYQDTFLIDFGSKFALGEQTSYIVYIVARATFDLLFFVLFVLFFANIILVVMVDGLQDYRDKVDERQKTVDSRCVICALQRDTIAKTGVTFKEHVDREHNVIMYLDLVATIIQKPLTDYSGAENYIAQCLYQGNWDFIPFNTSLCVEQRNRRAEELELNGGGFTPHTPGSTRRKAPLLGTPSRELGRRGSDRGVDRLLSEKMETLGSELKQELEEVEHRLMGKLDQRAELSDVGRASQGGETQVQGQGQAVVSEDAGLDEDAKAWLDSRDLAIAQAQLGSIGSSLADMAGVTPEDVDRLSGLKLLQRRRLVAALATLPGSACAASAPTSAAPIPARPATPAMQAAPAAEQAAPATPELEVEVGLGLELQEIPRPGTAQMELAIEQQLEHTPGA